MCWAIGNNARAVFIGLLGAALASGCARPKGVLFEPIDPPKVWPPAPDAARIKLLGAVSDSRDLKAARSGAEAFKAALRGPRRPIVFAGPQMVAYHPRGTLAVTDPAGAAVHLLDLHTRDHIRVAGFGEQRFGAPMGVTWAEDRLFVTDAQRHEVIELDTEGGFRGNFGADLLQRPVGIAYVPQRQCLYVVDGGAHHLAVFDTRGELVTALGGPGLEAGEFNYPTHICSQGDQLLVTDSGNFRIQLLDLDGRSLRTFGQKGDGAGDFALPKGVAFDREGHVYVVDARFENVQIFDTEGRLLMAFGEEGRELGAFWLPAGIAIDPQNRIWIADTGNRRIQVFAYIGVSL